MDLVRRALAVLGLLLLVGAAPDTGPEAMFAGRSTGGGGGSPLRDATVILDPAGPLNIPFSTEVTITVEHDGSFGQGHYLLDCDNGTPIQESVLSAGEPIDATHTTYTFDGPCVYTVDAVYTVEVTIKTSSGTTLDVATRNITANPNATPIIENFTAPAGVVPYDPTFTGLASQGNSASYAWKLDCDNNCTVPLPVCTDGCWETVATAAAALNSAACSAFGTTGLKQANGCVTDGGGNTAKATTQFLVSPQTFAGSLAANPVGGSDPLNNVELALAIDTTNTSCPFAAGYDAEFFCFLGDPAPLSKLGLTGDTYSTVADAGWDCDYTEGTYSPRVRVTCPATTGTLYPAIKTNLVVTDGVAKTLVLSPAPSNPSGPAPLATGYTVVATGDATGDITAITVDCDTDGTIEHTGNITADPESPFTDEQLDPEGNAQCVYGADGTYTLTVCGTREGVSDCGTTTIEVDTPQLEASLVVDKSAITRAILVNNTGAFTDTFCIGNGTPGAALTWSFTESGDTNNVFSAAPTSGTATTEQDCVTVTTTYTGLPVGFYTATYTVRNGFVSADVKTVVATLEVQNPSSSVVPLTSVTHPHFNNPAYDITITFNCSVGGGTPSTACSCWRYVDGYYGCRPGADGKVWITAATPAKAGTVAGNTLRNGHHLHIGSTFEGSKQWYDSRGRGGDTEPEALPVQGVPNSTFIKTASGTVACGGTANIENAVPLTIMASAPANPSQTFRPPAYGPRAHDLLTTNVRTDLLPSIAPLSMPSMATAFNRSRYFRNDYNTAYWSGDVRAVHGCVMDNYGTNYTMHDEHTLARLFSTDSLSSKLPTLYGYMQYGIDWYGNWAVGGRGGDLTGGNSNGKLLAGLFAAVMLNHPGMLAEVKQALDENRQWETAMISNCGSEPLWGTDSAATDEEWSGNNPGYWDGFCAGVNNPKTERDPYCNIDGGSIPGASYMGQTQNVVSFQSMLWDLMPELGAQMDAWGYGWIKDYGTRARDEGIRMLPDNCAMCPADAAAMARPTDHASYGVTWGNDPLSSDCIHGSPNREDVLNLDGDVIQSCPSGSGRCTQEMLDWYTNYWDCSKACGVARCPGTVSDSARCP